ncbi:MAG TPA: Rab family GTPase [Thermoplasmata archaeon]|nr:Rab family GTPase [Thermoplasmata archaeon]
MEGRLPKWRIHTPDLPLKNVKMKICLIGEEGVGKTSLIRRYVFSQFDEKYLRTVGTMVSKKVVDLGPVEGTMFKLHMLVWDIMGRRDFMSLYKEAYFSRARGILAVCDMTRPETLDALNEWMEGINSSIGEAPMIVLANKKDMGENLRVDEDDILALCELHAAPYLLTSARTGENVEVAFQKIAEMAVRSRFAGQVPEPAETVD